MKLHERIFELALSRSFFFPSNEIYKANAGFYDFGPTGLLMKKRMENLWRRMFIQEEGFHEIESTTVTPEIVLQASGHVDEFTDPVVECKKCSTKFRADHIIENKGVKWDGKLETLNKVIKEKDIHCSSCGGKFSDAVFSNLMFATGIGVEASKAYLRPETAQGIFTSFHRIFRNHGMKLPIAVGQIGRSFRNEISPRKALVRLREFTQMELEYFFNPAFQNIENFEQIKEKKIILLTREAQEKKEKPVEISAGEMVEKGICNEIMAHFLVKEWEYYKKVGLDEKRMWFRHLLDNETPHYSKGNMDLEVETSYGVIEIAGNAYRTDYDLRQHQKFSRQNLEVFDPKENKKVLPHVVEVSMGVDRMFFCVLEHSFREKSKEKEWEWFEFSPLICPYEVAVFPLVKKDGLLEKAEELAKQLREDFQVFFHPSGSIGRRYARADEIGISYSLTIDYDTMEDNTVTIRERNTGKQERVKIENLKEEIKKKISAFL